MTDSYDAITKNLQLDVLHKTIDDKHLAVIADELDEIEMENVLCPRLNLRQYEIRDIVRGHTYAPSRMR